MNGSERNVLSVASLFRVLFTFCFSAVLIGFEGEMTIFFCFRASAYVSIALKAAFRLQTWAISVDFLV